MLVGRSLRHAPQFNAKSPQFLRSSCRDPSYEVSYNSRHWMSSGIFGIRHRCSSGRHGPSHVLRFVPLKRTDNADVAVTMERHTMAARSAAGARMPKIIDRHRGACYLPIARVRRRFKNCWSAVPAALLVAGRGTSAMP